MSKSHDLEATGVSRREFLSRSAALGAASALPASLLTESTLASAPKKGGRARIAFPQIPETLDPELLPNARVSWLIFNNLVEIDADGQAKPELAEGWESSPGAKRWVFELRKGVEFHNGKSLEAKDVVASMKRHGKKSGAGVIVERIKRVRADGKHTVVFELKEGNADFPYLMSDYHLVIAPAGRKAKKWNEAVGTGAYILREWQSGKRVLAARNPSYWKEGRGHFDEIEMLAIPDSKARSNAVRAGEVDIASPVDLKTLDLLKKIPAIQIVEVTGTTHVTLPMRTDKSPFDNNDVRLALKHGIDREALVSVVKRGHAVPGNDHPIGPTDRYHADELPQREYDPDKSKFHLKKAGMASLSVKLSSADVLFAGAVETAVLYAEQAAKAGIKIEVLHESDKGYWSKVWKKKPWCVSVWQTRPTPDWMFSQGYVSGAEWNESFWKHKRFDKLVKDARAELDDGKRREMYVEMQRIVLDEGGVVVPFFENHVMAASSKLAFGKVAGNWELDGMRMAERWWFA